MSRRGNKPIVNPENVEGKLDDKKIYVKGKKRSLIQTAETMKRIRTRKASSCWKKEKNR